MTCVEEGPNICVWDSRLGPPGEGPARAQELVRLELAKDAGAAGFCALAFSPSGTRLVVVATDLVHAIPLAAVAGTGYLFAGLVDWTLLLNLLAGSIPAIVLGSLLAGRVPGRWIQISLAVVLIVAGVKTMV